jgi:alpha-beta hydrolase superfamily lysophospholipase
LAPETATATTGKVESADGTGLAYRGWPIAGGPIALAAIHGLGEHAGRYERFAKGMAQHGMGTYALDLRGHGNSPGPRGHVDSWAQWTDDVAAFVKHIESIEKATEVVPVGHSFGGVALLTTVLAGKLPNTKRFVVSSPALKLKVKVAGWKLTFGPIAAKIVPRLALANEVDAKTVSRIPEVVDAYRNDPLVHNKISTRLGAEWQNAAGGVLARAGQIKIPFLILAGTADALIDPAGSEQLHDQTKSTSELRMLEGRFHEPFNDLGSDEVFQLIADWLKK